MKKKNIIYVSLFILFLFVGDRMIGLFSRNILRSSRTDFYGMINKSIEDTSQVFILGSSRAECHYNSNIMSSKLKRSVFNAGAGGFGPFYSYAVLKERLKKHKPSMVVLDIVPVFMVNKNQYEVLSKLRPMVDIYPSFAEIVKLDPEYKRGLMLLESYKYNSTLFDLVHGLKAREKQDAFLPLQETMKGDAKIDQFDIHDYNEYEQKQMREVAKLQLEYVDKIAAMCKDNGIPLLFVISPLYADDDKYNYTENIVLDHFGKKGYRLLNYMNDYRFAGNAKMFRDMAHLNVTGADRFTRIFAETLKK